MCICVVWGGTCGVSVCVCGMVCVGCVVYMWGVVVVCLCVCGVCVCVWCVRQEVRVYMCDVYEWLQGKKCSWPCSPPYVVLVRKAGNKVDRARQASW